MLAKGVLGSQWLLLFYEYKSSASNISECPQHHTMSTMNCHIFCKFSEFTRHLFWQQTLLWIIFMLLTRLIRARCTCYTARMDIYCMLNYCANGFTWRSISFSRAWRWMATHTHIYIYIYRSNMKIKVNLVHRRYHLATSQFNFFHQICKSHSPSSYYLSELIWQSLCFSYHKHEDVGL